MPRGLERNLRFSSGLLVILGYVGLVTLPEVGLALVLVPFIVLAFMPMFERLDAGTSAYRWISQIVTILYAFVFLPLSIATLGLIASLIILFMFIQTFLLWHRKGVREYRYIYLMAFFLIVGTCSQSPEPAFGLVVPLFMVSAVWASSMLRMVEETSQNPALADLLPAPNAARDTSDPYAVMAANVLPRTVTISLTAISIGAIVLTLALFLFTPRMEAGVFGSATVSGEFRTDVDTSVDLSRGGRITADEAPVFRAMFPDEPNGRFDGPMYWRVTTLNRFEGAQWDRVNIRPDDVIDGAQYQDRGRGINLPRTGQGRMVYQEIFLDDPDVETGLPCLSMVRSVRAQTGRIALDEGNDYTVVLWRYTGQSLTYRVVSEVMMIPPARLRETPGEMVDYQNALNRDYGRLTQEYLSPRSRELATQIMGRENNVYDKVKAVERWFTRQDYLYTLDIPEVRQGDPVEHFLHVTRAGNCELYASAMVLLLRSQGIPARLAVGYRGGEWSDTDRSYLVRKSMAHMWVEVYFIGYGWLTFDPTPPDVGPEDTWWNFVTRAATRTLLNAKVIYYRDLVGYTGGVQVRDLVRVTLGLISFDVDVIMGALRSITVLEGAFPRIILAAALGGASWFLLLFYLSRKRAPGLEQVRLTKDQLRARRLLRKLRRRLSRLGVECRGMSPAEILERLEQTTLIDRDDVTDLIEAYAEARFGGRPMNRARLAALLARVRGMRGSKSVARAG